MTRSTLLSHPAKLLLPLALLLALAAPLCRAAPSSAKGSGSACSSPSARAKRPVRACAGRARPGNSHGKAKRRRLGSRHPIKKKKATQRGAVHSPATAAKPTATVEAGEAECDDGSAPEPSGSGSYACEDGSRPACADGSQPALSGDGSMLVCLAHGAPSSPAPASAEEDEGEAEG